jgi:ferric-dicitrate binding protein FerR (iron transport regulator)
MTKHKTQNQYVREQSERAEFWEKNAYKIWRETHPEHTAADFERWRSCNATAAQAAEFERWVVTVFDRRMADAGLV